ncbi:hypothetical protein V5O48_014068 [Marasmius crinis-equi]|uniref:Uncharacterized protein n=1 Tax=Marasmius crinis-equi TaxID=585013 RepID=A0ABR3EYC2_9AGAR
MGVPPAVEDVDNVWQIIPGIIVVVILLSSLALGSQKVLARRGLGLLFTLPVVVVVSIRPNLLDPSIFSGVESVDILDWWGHLFNDAVECVSVSLSASPNAVVGDLIRHSARLVDMASTSASVAKALSAVGLFLCGALSVYWMLTMFVSCMETVAWEFFVALPARQATISGSHRRLRQTLRVVAFNLCKVIGDWVFTQIFNFLRFYALFWFTVIVFCWVKEEEEMNLVNENYVLDKLHKSNPDAFALVFNTTFGTIAPGSTAKILGNFHKAGGMSEPGSFGTPGSRCSSWDSFVNVPTLTFNTTAATITNSALR